MDNNIKKSKNNKKSDNKFSKVKIKHDPQAESTRATYTESDGEDF